MTKSDERGTDYEIQKWMVKRKNSLVWTVRGRGRSVRVDMICVLCKRCYDKEYKCE